MEWTRSGRVAVSAVLAVLLLVLAPAPRARGAEKPTVVAAHVADQADVSKLVLEFSEAAKFRWFSLADPYRVVIDFADVAWKLPPQIATPANTSIERLRYGPFKPGVARIVLDLRGPRAVRHAGFVQASDKRSHLFIVDLGPSSHDAFLASVKNSAPEEKTALSAPPGDRASKVPEKRIVAIDPGHGGVDPGAIGANGAYEKTITLAVARLVKERLESTGRYTVVLTRERDVFVALRKRIQIARAAKAQLFVSLHADKVDDASTRGASIYTLSETASDKEAEALAAKENKADLIAGIDLSDQSHEVANILIDLAQRETKNNSAQFANALVTELGKSVLLLRNTHRFAGFAVLKAPDVPSVLIEMGYLSNGAEEKLLGRNSHRAKLADAIARAVDRYFEAADKARRS